MRKTESYKLFRYDVILSERNMSDHLRLEKLYLNAIENEKDEYKKAILNIEITLQRIIDSLSYWLKSINWFKRLLIKRKLRLTYLLNNLSPKEIQEIIAIIDKLEGVEPESKDSKKKVIAEDNQQVE